mgnify:CR=1 FL=1
MGPMYRGIGQLALGRALRAALVYPLSADFNMEAATAIAGPTGVCTTTRQ